VEVDQVVEEGQKARKFASDSKIKKLTIQIE
jgi:hypothetical protein